MGTRFPHLPSHAKSPAPVAKPRPVTPKYGPDVMPNWIDRVEPSPLWDALGLVAVLVTVAGVILTLAVVL